MALTEEPIVKAIVGVLILLVLIGTSATLFKPALEKVAQVVINALTPYGKANPFPENTVRDPALDSVNGLLYGVNRVAWYGKLSSSDQQAYAPQTFDKKFGKVSVLSTYYDGESIALKDDAASKNAIARKSVDCRQIFNDKGEENSICSTFTGFTAEDIDSYEAILNEYKNNPDCDKSCKDILNDITSWPQNYHFEIDKSTLDSTKEITMCIKKDNLLGLGWAIYVTEKDNYALCELPANDLNFKFGMKVKDFSLPQEFPESSPLLTLAKNWVHGYGDPKYIMYYEKFPQGEDTYWHPAAYAVDWVTIVTIQGIFMMLDFIPMGKIVTALGGGAKDVLSAFIKKTVPEFIRTPITGLFQVMKDAIERFQSEVLPRIMERATPEILQRMFLGLGKVMKNEFFQRLLVRDFGEEAVETSVREGLESGLTRDFVDQLIEQGFVKDLSERITSEAQQKLVQELGENAFEEGGKKLSTAGRKRFLEIVGEALDSSENMNSQIRESIMQNLEARFDEGITFEELAVVARRFKVTNRVNDYVAALAKDMKGIPLADKKAYLEEMYKSAGFLDNIDPSDLSTLTKNLEEDMPIAMQMYEQNNQLLETLGIDPTEFLKLSGTERNVLLDTKFAEAFGEAIPKDLNIVLGNRNGMRVMKKWMTSPRQGITAVAVVLNDQIESLNEKFTPVGTNAIGVRTPYMATSVYDDTLTSGWKWPTNKQYYLDFFSQYGGYLKNGSFDPTMSQRYRGLLPDVNDYYLSLVKDQNRFWFDQPNDRFHLVSPCYADVLIRETTCSCYGYPQEDTRGTQNPLLAWLLEKQGAYETNVYNPLLDQTMPNFDGMNKMLYEIGDNGVVVKKCDPQNVFSEVFGKENLYTPKCLAINPVLDPSEDVNYCYHGQTAPGLVLADIALNYVLPISTVFIVGGSTGAICGTATAPSGPGLIIGAGVCAAVAGPISGAVTGTIGGITYAALATNNAWPNHVAFGG